MRGDGAVGWMKRKRERRKEGRKEEKRECAAHVWPIRSKSLSPPPGVGIARGVGRGRRRGKKKGGG